VVTVIDAGRIPQPAPRTQPNRRRGGHGIGMSLSRASYDPRNGAPINSNLADYIVAANANVPSLEVHFVEHPDTS